MLYLMISQLCRHYKQLNYLYNLQFQSYFALKRYYNLVNYKKYQCVIIDVYRKKKFRSIFGSHEWQSDKLKIFATNFLVKPTFINGGFWLVLMSKLVVGHKNDCQVTKKTPIYFSVTTLLIPQKVSNKVTQWARFCSVLPSWTLSRK